MAEHEFNEKVNTMNKSALQQFYDKEFRSRAKTTPLVAAQVLGYETKGKDFVIKVNTADTIYITIPHISDSGMEALADVRAAGTAGSAGTAASASTASSISSTLSTGSSIGSAGSVSSAS